MTIDKLMSSETRMNVFTDYLIQHPDHNIRISREEANAIINKRYNGPKEYDRLIMPKYESPLYKER